MLDDLRANTRRVARTLLAGFALVALALGYWQIVRGADLAQDPANPRVATARQDEPRGRILDRNGVVLADGSPRHYADPSLVHTIGFHSDRFGDTDLEAAYDAELRGERALSPVDRLLQQVVHTAPRPNDLVLTVDKRIHDAAIQALGTSAGSIVVLDPRTGAVLAMASTPYFDPNTVDEQMQNLVTDPKEPLFNRAVQALYVPGSTFKTVTATAAVDKGLVDLNETFMCTTAVKVGMYSVDCRNSQHIPRLTYKQAYAWSSNRVFGLTGMLLGFPNLAPINPWLDDKPPGPYPWSEDPKSIEASAGVLEDYARRFGFERSIPFDLPVSVSQVKNSDTQWSPELLVQTSFGQGELDVTPMQMALVVAAVANGGHVPTPYVAAQLRSGSDVRQLHEPGQSFSTASSADVANTLVSFMVEGVDNGYAAKAAIPGVKVGGKTGTAEVGDGTSHSWFIGFAPADAPRIAVAVILEHQGSGSDFATPAAQSVMRTALAVYH
ncbi:MAG: penicillin-binding protein 2 [Chloroflexi bacterium]|nr:penicillin-binding protein 2 [Chloroflexota bacterium]MBV9135385.1 penicillin-binding protein 2 [Chloroflexota bacterium]MBV9893272.1 penicillin-binding protein 2 [Chloroflexota bacterium]